MHQLNAIDRGPHIVPIMGIRSGSWFGYQLHGLNPPHRSVREDHHFSMENRTFCELENHHLLWFSMENLTFCELENHHVYPFLMGQLTISTGHILCRKLLNYQRVNSDETVYLVWGFPSHV